VRRILSIATLLVIGGLISYQAYRSRGVIPGEVSDADVHRFVDAIYGLAANDSACVSLEGYFRAASRGLRAYESKLGMNRRQLCRAIRRAPARYSAIEAKLGALDSAVTQVDSIFARFRAIYPAGRQPGVYFVVGAGMALGTTTHTSDPVVLIGVERAGDPSRLASVVAHEFVHTQQDYPWIGILTGGPSFLRGTLLRQSIMEGSANLIAELVTGVPSRNEYGEAHEAELWTEFSREMHGKDYSRWLWNGGNPRRGELPADLGYWIGYRITKAYYDRAADKPRAIHDILTIRDFDRFLTASGYAATAPLTPPLHAPGAR
jgi:Predicted Zn-dependent protease (DUF2268)